jgi:sterol desaturase/sphingolipid hydroxylase (fatty acid hydroxylase superfamily)
MTAHEKLNASVTTLALIAAGMLVLALVEAVIPLHRRSVAHREHVGPNLALTAITIATNLVFNSALVAALDSLRLRGFGVLRWVEVGPVASAFLGVVVLDFSFYVTHVAMHRVPAFWRVHAVHHSDPVVDVTTTIRQHPLEGVLRYAFMAAFACAFGVTLSAFVVYRAWSVLNGLLEHANLRIPRGLDRVLVLFTTWPSMHKIHHSRRPDESCTNYGNIFSWFDRMLGTYAGSSDAHRVQCGVDGLDDPTTQSLRGLLALPFMSELHPMADSRGAASR